METLTFDDLHEAVAGTGVGIRSKMELQPLGGPGDKVFPPTYGVADSEETKYAVEKRRVNGESVDSVVLDSVASQANRLELALLDSYRRKEISIPVVSVDFRDTELAGFDRISALEAPHRVFDALLRDSILDDTLFRLSEPGIAITEATARNASALYHYSPTTLVFGGWDSTGPKGGKGAKYERAITSEIVGIGVDRGVKTGSRIDPTGIELRAGPLYEAPDGTWALREDEAALDDKGKPKLYKGTGEGQAGRPSQANHGNVTPSIDRRAGGVTVDHIVATTVLSFAALRRLRFPLATDGSPIADVRRQAVASSAHTALAALGLAAVVLAFEEGFDLRSRCVLVASAPLRFELLDRSGTPRQFTLDRETALSILNTATQTAASAGLAWMSDELLLRPTERLVQLIGRSHELARAEAGSGA